MKRRRYGRHRQARWEGRQGGREGRRPTTHLAVISLAEMTSDGKGLEIGEVEAEEEKERPCPACNGGKIRDPPLLLLLLLLLLLVLVVKSLPLIPSPSKSCRFRLLLLLLLLLMLLMLLLLLLPIRPPNLRQANAMVVKGSGRVVHACVCLPFECGEGREGGRGGSVSHRATLLSLHCHRMLCLLACLCC